MIWIATMWGPLARADGEKPSITVHQAVEIPKLLQELSHGRPLVFHVCATWCSACENEFVHERKMFRGLAARGVSMVLVFIDEAKTRPAIPAMIKKHGLTALPAFILDAPDPAPVAAALGEPSWDGALPATFVYDSHQAKVRSFLGEADPALLAAAIDEALRRSK